MFILYKTVLIVTDYRAARVRFEIGGTSKEQLQAWVKELKNSLEQPTTDDLIDYLKKKCHKTVGVTFSYSQLN